MSPSSLLTFLLLVKCFFSLPIFFLTSLINYTGIFSTNQFSISLLFFHCFSVFNIVDLFFWWQEFGFLSKFHFFHTLSLQFHWCLAFLVFVKESTVSLIIVVFLCFCSLSYSYCFHTFSILVFRSFDAVCADLISFALILTHFVSLAKILALLILILLMSHVLSF
jgi:hypothetical protein